MNILDWIRLFFAKIGLRPSKKRIPEGKYCYAIGRDEDILKTNRCPYYRCVEKDIRACLYCGYKGHTLTKVCGVKDDVWTPSYEELEDSAEKRYKELCKALGRLPDELSSDL